MRVEIQDTNIQLFAGATGEVISRSADRIGKLVEVKLDGFDNIGSQYFYETEVAEIMTVHDLIEQLQFCDAPDAPVMVETASGERLRIVRASYDESTGPVCVEVK